MSNTHTFLLSLHTTLGGPLHPDRTDKTVLKTSLKPYSCSIMEGSEMCCAFPYTALPWLCPSATSQTVNLNILVIYCQLCISAVTHAILSNCITARRERMDFSVSNARILSREDCLESNLHCACVCEWNIEKVMLYFEVSLQFYLLFWIIFCLFGRLVFCVWAIGVESDKEWE